MQTETTTTDTHNQLRAAYTLEEFAQLFGKERTWAYRMKYDGKIKVLPSTVFLGGGDMVPQSEVERLLREATVYSDEIAGKAVPRGKPRRKRRVLNGTKAAVTRRLPSAR